SYVDRPALTYLVLAAAKTELTPYTWWFLFVGRVPYKGFFSEEAAKAEADSLANRGYDTLIRMSPAFSTLGWFNDPLLTHLLKYDKVTLADVIFHELFHNTLYISGAGNFNESLANFIGSRAAIAFFRDRHGEGSPEYQAAVQVWKDKLEFSAFIAELAASLKELYGKDLPEEEKLRLREEIFARSQEEWSARIAGRAGHSFRGFGQQKINNAVVLHYLLYYKELDLFESLYQKQEKDLMRVVELARNVTKKSGDPFEAIRQAVREIPPTTADTLGPAGQS
ncbi:MAG: aminopeptidase, partial [Deltaproteobacteria bacterium]|nr:aminopeptidase [Deltaproteobacteria bacterium]